jgi:hypothetical protein
MTLLMTGTLRAVRNDLAAAELTTSRINGFEACDTPKGSGVFFATATESINVQF